jgi:hypothetical protein
VRMDIAMVFVHRIPSLCWKSSLAVVVVFGVLTCELLDVLISHGSSYGSRHCGGVSICYTTISDPEFSLLAIVSGLVFY